MMSKLAIDRPKHIDIDEAIDLCGMGSYQWWLILAIGLLFSADSTEVLLLSFVSQVLRANWGISVTEASTLVGVVFGGQIVGSIIFGPLADAVGRRKVVLLIALTVIVFGLLSAAASSFALLLFFRVIVGVGVGGLAVPFDATTEFLKTETRGFWLTLLGYFWTFGQFLSVGFAYWFLGTSGNKTSNPNGWRWFAIASTTPMIVSALILIRYFHESPRWLLARGRHAEAVVVLRDIARQNGKDGKELYPDDTVLTETKVQETKHLRKLFTPKWRKMTVLTLIVWFSIELLYFGALLDTTKLFSKAKSDPSSRVHGGYSFVYLPILIGFFGELVGRIYTTIVIDRIGRRYNQAISHVFGGLSFLALTLFVYFDVSNVGKVIFAFLSRIFFASAIKVNWITTAELLPTGIRGSGNALANAVGKVGAFVVAYLVGGNISQPVVGVILLTVALVAAAASLGRPETLGVNLGCAIEDDDDGSKESVLRAGVEP